MSGTIQYDENGAIDPNLDKIREGKEDLQEAQGQDVYTEEGGDHVEDPTAMTGTLDTSDTTGTQQTADQVSAVFDEANGAFADGTSPAGVPEGAVGQPYPDPADSGENLDPATGTEPFGGEANADAAEAKSASTSDESSDFDSSKDPGDYKVSEVLAYFNAEGTRKQSIDKVKRAEADGQNRKTIVEFEKA